MHSEFRWQGDFGSGDSYCWRVQGGWANGQHARKRPATSRDLTRRGEVHSDFYCALKIRDSVGNEYGKPKDIVGETRMAFTAHADGPFDVCFENILVTGRTLLPHPPYLGQAFGNC